MEENPGFSEKNSICIHIDSKIGCHPISGFKDTISDITYLISGTMSGAISGRPQCDHDLSSQPESRWPPRRRLADSDRVPAGGVLKSGSRLTRTMTQTLNRDHGGRGHSLNLTIIACGKSGHGPARRLAYY